MKKQSNIDAILSQVKGNQKTRRIAAALACLVVLVTLWRLTLPAITLEWGKPQAEGITEPEMEETLQEEELLTEETLSNEAEEEEPLLRWATLKEAEEAGYPDAVRVDRLICGHTESEGHTHSEDCIESYYTAQAASFTEEAVLAMPAQRFEGEAGSLSVRVDAAEGTFPEETEMALTEADAAEVRRAAAGLVNGRISQVLAVDIGFLYEGEKIEPEQPVQVVLSGSALEGMQNPVVLHIDGEGNAEIVSHRTAEEPAPAPRLRMAAQAAQPEETLAADIAEEDSEGAEAEVEAEDGIPKGALVFEAEEFSVYAVVSYTVDFEYEVDGQIYQFSLSGGEKITLSQLAEALGIIGNTVNGEEAAFYSAEEFLKEVEKVEFSDESLVKVTPVEGDWELESLAPFDTEESLTITMKNGDVITVKVTDAQGDSNLNNLISNVEVSDSGSTVQNGGTVVVGRTYKFHFEFSEIGDKQIGTDGTLKYTVPEGIDMTQLNGSFDIKYSGRTYSGNTFTYDPATREITIHFTDTVKSLISKSGDTKFNIDIDGQFTGEKQQFEFGNGITKDYEMDTSNSVDIDKTGSYSSTDNKVHYTVTAKSNGKSENVVVTDAISGTALTLDTDSIQINGQAPAPGVVTANENGFTANLGTLNDKETVTITYTASVDFDNLTGKGTVQQTGNTVKIKSDTDEKEKPTDVANQIDYNPLQKSAGTATGEGNTKTLPWTITVNGQQLKSVAGATITDTNRSSDVMHYSGNGISIAVMDGNRVVRTITKTWAELGVDPATATGWSYTLPETQDDLNNAYKYVITYNTEVDASGKVSDFNVNNTVSDDDGHQGGGGGTVPPGDDKVTLQKDALPSSNAVQSDWSISFDVPAGGLSSAVLTDTFPNTYSYGSHMIDGFVEDSVSISGLEDEESYDIAVTDSQLVITFYKTGEKTQANQGLTGTGEKRTVTVTLSTENNPAWVEAASGTAHTNTASLNVNGQVITDTAQTFPANEGIAKTGRYQGTAEIEGKNVPFFKYTITLYGISDDSFDENGNLKNSITDRYASKWLTIWLDGGSSRRLRSTDGVSISGDDLVAYTDANGILTFTPKKTDFPTYDVDGQPMYYSAYQMDYYLRVKDDKLSGDNGILMASLNGGVELKNEVQWDEFKDDVTIDYEYPVVDKEQTQTGRDHDGIVKYKVVLNPEKLTLNGGEAMEMQDNAQGITVDYSTIVITAEDAAGNDVSDQIDYYYRGYTGYYTIPDSTKVTIMYSARIIGDGVVTYSNDVTMKGFRDSTKNTETINSSGGGNLNIDWVVVYKHKYQNMKIGLNGATYVLTDADGNPVVYPETADASKGFVPGEPVLFTTEKTDLHTLPDGTQLDEDGNAVSEGHPHVPEERDGYAWIYLSKEDTGLALQKGVTYYFKEYAAPEGYQIANTVYSFTISEHPNYDNWEYYKGDILRLADKPVKGILEVHKTIEGADNLTDTQKKQITFTIKAKDTNGEAMLFPYKLDADDNPVYITDAEAGLTISYADFVDGVYRLNNLPNGIYTVTETNAVLGGYTHTETTWQIENGMATAIESGARATPGETVTITDAEAETPATHKVTYNNKYDQQEARLTIVKKGESDSLYLYGATFQLSRWDDTANDYVPVSNTEFPYLTSDGEFTIDYENRKTGVTLTNLPTGRYRLVETKAPTNYQLDDTPIYFTVGAKPDRTVSNGNASGNNSDNQNLTFTAAAADKPAEYEVKNRVAHTYTLTKVDSIRVAKKLNGAEFVVVEITGFDADGAIMQGGSPIGTYTTGQDGTITIDADDLNLQSGKLYAVYETKAPAGYELSREVYAFYLGRVNDVSPALINGFRNGYGNNIVSLKDGPQVGNVPNTEEKMDLYAYKQWYKVDGTKDKDLVSWIDEIEVQLYQVVTDSEGNEISNAPYPDAETTYKLTKGAGGNASYLDYKWTDLPTGDSVNTDNPLTYTYYVKEVVPEGYEARYVLGTSDANSLTSSDVHTEASDITVGADTTVKTIQLRNAPKTLNLSMEKVWMDDGSHWNNNSVTFHIRYTDNTHTFENPGTPSNADLGGAYKVDPSLPGDSNVSGNRWAYDWPTLAPWTDNDPNNPRTYFVLEDSGHIASMKGSGYSDPAYTIVETEDGEKTVITNTKTTSDKLQVKKVWLNEDGTKMSEAPDTPVTVQLQRQAGKLEGVGITIIAGGSPKVSNQIVATGSDLSFVLLVNQAGEDEPSVSIDHGTISEPTIEDVGWTKNYKYNCTVTEISSDMVINITGQINGNSISWQFDVKDLNYEQANMTIVGDLEDVSSSVVSEPRVTLSSSNNWMKDWGSLPTNDGHGNTWYYSVREFPVPAGYDVSYENNDGITTGIMYIKNTKSEYTRAMAYKKWLNANGTEMDAAPADASVTFTLYQDGRRVKDVVLDGTPDENGEDTAWTAVWEGLEVINKRTGDPYVYTVKETSGFTGYAVYRLATDAEITANEGVINGPNSAKLIAGDGDTAVASGETIYNKKARSLTVTKAWQDEQDATLTDIPEGTTVTIGLYKAGETAPVKTIELDGHADVNGESPEWVANFTNLEDGTTYTVKEEGAPSGFTLVSTQLNNGELVTEPVSAEVTLANGDNTVIYTNKKNEPEFGTLVIKKEVTTGSESAAASQTFSFEVTLTNADADAQSENPFTGTVKVTDQTRPTPTEVELKEEPQGKLTVTVSGTGTATITDIPAGTKYAVTETSIPAGWKQSGVISYVTNDTVQQSADQTIAANETETATVTNTETTSIEATKKWQNADGSDVAAESLPNNLRVTFDLYQSMNSAEPTKVDVDGKSIVLDGTTDTNGEETAWKATWTDLDKYDASGNQITYSVKESKVEKTSDSGANWTDVTNQYVIGTWDETAKTITNKPTSFSFTKVWYDVGDNEVDWVNDISVTLYSTDGSQETTVGTFTLTSRGGTMGDYTWTAEPLTDGGIKRTKFTITGLPATSNDGSPLTYYVREAKVSGYMDPVYAINTPGSNISGKVGSNTDRAEDGEYIQNKLENSVALPSTGGPGTRTITLAGLALTLLALAGIAGKRKSRA